MAHYGKFENVKNYIAIVGNKNNQEKAGYYGEKIVLKCPELGLNTCWVAMTYGKSKAEIKRGQKRQPATGSAHAPKVNTTADHYFAGIWKNTGSST